MTNTNTNPDSATKQLGGYRIVIAVLAVVLVGLSVLYYNIHRQQQAEYVVLSGERDAVQENLTQVMAEFEALETTNSTLRAEMDAEKARTEGIIAQLQKEKKLSLSKLRQYERQIKELRSTVSEYVKQIDSLDSLNKNLLAQNVDLDKQLTESDLRAEKAEELAKNLQKKVEAGARLVATSVNITAYNKKNRVVTRIKKAPQISIDCVIAANKLAKKGETEIIARVTSPDGYVLTTEAMPKFKLEGKDESYTASRKVEFQGGDLPVSIFYSGKFVAGVYKVELYNAGAMIGSAELDIK